MRLVSLPKGSMQILVSFAVIAIAVLNKAWELPVFHFVPFAIVAGMFLLSGVIDLIAGIKEHMDYLKELKEDPFDLTLTRVAYVDEKNEEYFIVDKPVKKKNSNTESGFLKPKRTASSLFRLSVGTSQYKDLQDDDCELLIEVDDKGQKKVTKWRKIF